MENKNVFEPLGEEPAQNTAENTAETIEARAEARKNLIAGALWCLGGLIFTFASYYFASAGSRYFIATGAIIWGAIQAAKGLFTLLSIMHQEGDTAAFWRTIGLTVGAAGAFVFLMFVAIPSMNGNEEEVIDSEQTYECKEMGFRCTIPAGYTELEADFHPETETVYAYYSCTTYNDHLGIDIESLTNEVVEEDGMSGLMEYCEQRDSEFYTDGFIAKTHPFQLGGLEMACSEGRIKEFADIVYANYDIIHGDALITITFRYEKENYGKSKTRERIEEVLSGIELF